MPKEDDGFKITRISADGMSIEVEGIPLANIDCDGLEIIDEDGNVVGAFTGFFALAGETMSEAIKRSLPPGCSLRLSKEKLESPI